ncbi:T3SS effector NleG family protein [Escherichia coli]|nr:T3SS effector NleG family protein [Escherichia coli]
MKHNRKRVFRTKYLNVSFLFVQRDFSARLRLFSVQLHWSSLKRYFVKNSDGSDVCTLFDAAAFSRLVGEGLPHPLTREPITASIIVKHEECIYDDTRGNFIIKGN